MRVPMIRLHQLFLAVLEEMLQALYPLIAGDKLPLGNSDLLLQAAILLDQLALDDGELLEVALKECHLLLLCLVIRGSQYVVILLSGLIQRYLKLDNLLLISLDSWNSGSLALTRSQRFCKSRIRLFFIMSNSANCCCTVLPFDIGTAAAPLDDLTRRCRSSTNALRRSFSDDLSVISVLSSSTSST